MNIHNASSATIQAPWKSSLNPNQEGKKKMYINTVVFRHRSSNMFNTNDCLIYESHRVKERINEEPEREASEMRN